MQDLEIIFRLFAVNGNFIFKFLSCSLAHGKLYFVNKL